MKPSLFPPISLAIAASLLAVLGLVAFFSGAAAVLPWLILAVAALTFLAAGRAFSVNAELDDQVLSRQSHLEVLQSEIAQRQQAVDVLADGLEIAIFICDPKATILYANRRAMEMFRFKEPRGRTVLAVTLSYDLEHLVTEAARLGESKTSELNFTSPEERIGLAKTWPHEIGNQVFLSIYEITDLRRLERIRQDFVANVSHELRTPLTVIRSMAETLAEGPDLYEERGPTYLQRIMSEVDRLSLISNDLLILSASESNIVRKHACDIAVVLRTAVRDLSAKASERGLVLSYNGPETFTIEANGSQMMQVALNLIENAINYTATGRVQVELESCDSNVMIFVRDTGIGIASEQLPRIFERFYRVDKGRSRATGGTGLGLSIVKHIVEAHGGTVKVESELHKGSTFAIKLPIGDISDESEAANQA